MQKFFTATLSSSCSIPIRTSILGTKKQQKQNNQFISNQLSQTNIVLSKINFKCELLCSYCLHFDYTSVSLLCAMSRAAIASRIASAELCQSASAHRFCVVLHAHNYCFAFRELLLLLVAQTRATPHSAAALSLSDVRVRGRCYFFWRSRRATFVRAQNCVATSCCR